MLENPFGTIKKPNETSHEANKKVVEDILSPEDAKRYAALLNTKHLPVEIPKALSDDEQAAITLSKKESKAENFTEWDRDDYCAWAASFGKDAAWVDQNFVFTSEDNVETVSDLYCEPAMVQKGSKPFFPPNLVKINGSLKFGGKWGDWIKGFRELVMPNKVIGSVDLGPLYLLDRVVFPEKIGSDLLLGQLMSGSKNEFPKFVGGNLEHSFLDDAQDWVFPEEVGGSLKLPQLKHAKRTTFPKVVGGEVDLRSLKFGSGVVLPELVGGNLGLDSLGFARGMTFPREVLGSVLLPDLRTIWGLRLPEKVGVRLEFKRLWGWEVKKLQKEYSYGPTVTWDV